jgi:hypothetical protein
MEEQGRQQSPNNEGDPLKAVKDAWVRICQFMRPVTPGLAWTAQNAGEITDEVLHSAAFQIVLALFLFLLAFILKVVSMTVAVIVAVMWWVSVFGIARSRRFKTQRPSKRIALTIGVAVLLAVPFALFARWGIGRLKTHESIPTANPQETQVVKLPHVLVFKFVPHKPAFGKVLMTNIHWRNDGQAKGAVYGYNSTYIVEPKPNMTMEDYDKLEEELFQRMKAGIKSPGVPLNMLVGGDYWVTVQGPAPTKKQAKKIAAGKARVYVVGIFRYVNLPNLPDAEYCIFWNQTQQAIFECHTHNE